MLTLVSLTIARIEGVLRLSADAQVLIFACYGMAIGLYQASEGESKTYCALGVGCCVFSVRCAPASSLGSGGVLLQVPVTAISHEAITDLASVA